LQEKWAEEQKQGKHSRGIFNNTLLACHTGITDRRRQ